MIARWRTASGRLSILPASSAAWITVRPKSSISINTPAALHARFARVRSMHGLALIISLAGRRKVRCRPSLGEDGRTDLKIVHRSEVFCLSCRTFVQCPLFHDRVNLLAPLPDTGLAFVCYCGAQIRNRASIAPISNAVLLNTATARRSDVSGLKATSRPGADQYGANKKAPAMPGLLVATAEMKTDQYFAMTGPPKV
jgi:hypothetical protein